MEDEKDNEKELLFPANLFDAVEKLEDRVTELENRNPMGKEALDLWMLLDDIDTLDDMCKDNDKLFRDQVMKTQKKRWNIIGENQIDALQKRFPGGRS